MPPIKWRKKDIDLLRKEVNRYNAKIRRMEQSAKYEGVKLPSRLSAKELMSTITERAEFNRTVKSIDRFFEKGTTKIVTGNKGFRNIQFNIDMARQAKKEADKLAEKERKRVERIKTKVGSVGDTGLTVAEMGDERLEDLKPRKDRTMDVKNESDWDRYVAMLEKRRNKSYYAWRKQVFYDNYMTAVRKYLWIEQDKIIGLMRDYNAEQFYDLYLENPDLAIEYIYAEEQMLVKAQRIIDILERATPPDLREEEEE